MLNYKSSLLVLPLVTLINTSIASPPVVTDTSVDSFLARGHLAAQIGGFWSSQGQQQHININTLIGDTFTVTKGDSGNWLLGLGYYIDGPELYGQAMSYGINAFYLAKSSVSGNVIQEDLFNNLSYHYNVTNYPVYAMASTKFSFQSNFPAVNLDVGIGPNFMVASHFSEQPLNSFTLPDHIFVNHTSTTFSATAGAYVQIKDTPIKVGYRFFYLGDGSFTPANNQVLNDFKTGSSYVNALHATISF